MTQSLYDSVTVTLLLSHYQWINSATTRLLCIPVPCCDIEMEHHFSISQLAWGLTCLASYWLKRRLYTWLRVPYSDSWASCWH